MRSLVSQKTRRLLVALLMALTGLAACTSKQPISIPNPIPASDPSVEPAISTPILSPTDPIAVSTTTPTPGPVARTHYRLAAKIDYAQHRVAVTETIDFWNSTPGALPALAFLVEPNRYPASFELQSITLAGQPAPEYTLDKNRLDLPLAQPLAPGGQITINLTYALNLPQIPLPSDTTRPIPYGYTERQLNLVDWYPCLPPYQPGLGWTIHTPGYYGEHQVYAAADYEVDLQLTNAPQGTLIAASAPAQQDGDNSLYRLDAARTFALSVSPMYKLAQKTINGVTVLDYYFPFNPAAGERVLQDTSDALALYSNLFGAYPHPTLSVVEADFLDGMEFDGLFFLSRGFYNLYDGTPKGYLTAIAVHETAHQWWFARVGNDQALEPWLDEAMATYTERIFYEKTYPDLVPWWWSFRVNYYQPEGWINQSVYDYGGFLPYRNAVYLRGALFLEDLRKRIGDGAFYAFLKDYAAQETHKISSRQEFFRILALHTQANLQDLISTYFKP